MWSGNGYWFFSNNSTPWSVKEFANTNNFYLIINGTSYYSHIQFIVTFNDAEYLQNKFSSCYRYAIAKKKKKNHERSWTLVMLLRNSSETCTFKNL